MQRAELEAYILETYPAKTDYPWVRYPGYQVFRHMADNRWFALLMDLPKRKLGLTEEGSLTVVNLKCDPVMIGELLTSPGFFPAYHMSKDSWITAALDGSVPEETLKILLDMSFYATKAKPKKRKSLPEE